MAMLIRKVLRAVQNVIEKFETSSRV